MGLCAERRQLRRAVSLMDPKRQAVAHAWAAWAEEAVKRDKVSILCNRMRQHKALGMLLWWRECRAARKRLRALGWRMRHAKAVAMLLWWSERRAARLRLKALGSRIAA